MPEMIRPSVGPMSAPNTNSKLVMAANRLVKLKVPRTGVN